MASAVGVSTAMAVADESSSVCCSVSAAAYMKRNKVSGFDLK
jgi:hypothetical protein